MYQRCFHTPHLLAIQTLGVYCLTLTVFWLGLQGSTAVAQQRDVDLPIVFEEERPLSYAGKYMTHLGRGPVDCVMEPISAALIELHDDGGPAFIAY